MKKIISLLIFFIGTISLMSFTNNVMQVDNKNCQFPTRKIRIDITATSPQGCTFRIVGEAEIIGIPLNPRIKSFTGTITLGGPGSCPQGTYNVSFQASFALSNELVVDSKQTDDFTIRFDTDEVCQMSEVSLSTASSSQVLRDACDTYNSSSVDKTPLIDALRDGNCR